MSGSVEWKCSCGAFGLRVRDVPASGAHVVCYCCDCRAFARLRDAAASLDPAGGVGLYQVAPESLEILRGAKHLRSLKLTARGPIRWYVECCGAPVANTAPFRAVPYASLMAAGFPEGTLDAPLARANRQSATGPVPKPHGSLLAMLASFARRTLASRLSGGWRTTPFFHDDGTPVARPGRPDPQARRLAYSRLP